MLTSWAARVRRLSETGKNNDAPGWVMQDLRPRFRPDIVAHWHDEKGGGRSLVLEDPAANKFFRISSYEYELLAVLNGTRTVQEAIERLRLQGRHFTEEHAIKLIDQFSREGLLLGTVHGSSGALAYKKKVMDKATESRSFTRLYFLFVPLINPDRFLDLTLWIWKLFVNRFTGLFVVLAAPGAIYLLVTRIPRLLNEYLFFFNLHNLVILWIAIAIMKLVHEFSHAYTAKSLGLRVPEMGMAFLIFFPCLYCNTTAAWQLASRNQRMLIAAAGILSEMVVAVVCVYIWSFTEPGLLNSVAFFLMAISLISSIFMNGNPLMRFDGYFMLTDLLRLPNLQTKSFGHLKYLFLNRTLGIDSVQDPIVSEDGKTLFTVYGASAFVYRIFLYTGIVAGVYFRFDKTVGVLLGAMALVLFIVTPVTRGAWGLLRRRSEMRFRPVGLLVFLLLLGGLAYVLTRPWSSNSVYPCYMDSKSVRQIVSPVKAPVSQVLVRQGDKVRKGQTIFSLDPERLQYELTDRKLELALIQTEISIIENTGESLHKAALKRLELVRVRESIEVLRTELNSVRWKAPFAGSLISLSPKLGVGSRVEKGEVLGEMASVEDGVIVGVVPGIEISKVSPGKVVEVWFPIGEGRSFSLTVNQVDKFKREDLQDSPLSSRFGGEIATEQKDNLNQDSPLETYYVCRIDFPDNTVAPLGMTGRMVVHEPPKSTLDRVVDAVYRVLREETVL